VSLSCYFVGFTNIAIVGFCSLSGKCHGFEIPVHGVIEIMVKEFFDDELISTRTQLAMDGHPCHRPNMLDA
jgi:hypothetical protein